MAAPADVPAPPVRRLASGDDLIERARFDCAVEVQQAQGYDPGASLTGGSIVGALVGGAVGGATGALVGLIDDIPGRGAAGGAIVAGGLGTVIGGLIKLDADIDAYHRGLAACLAARAAGSRPTPAPPDGLVEYRLRVLNVRDEAFTAFLGLADAAQGETGAGVLRFVSAADAGQVRGGVLYDRHPAPLSEAAARAWGATPAPSRIKLLDGRSDAWDEVRWYGRPGERSVWRIASRNRRPQAVRRVAITERDGLAHYRPLGGALFARERAMVTTVSLAYLRHAQANAHAADYVARYLDVRRGLAVVVGANEDQVFADEAYVVVTHPSGPATYEAVLAWVARGGERDTTGVRGD
jgi:hypothetical protein